MPDFTIAEIFSRSIADTSPEASRIRADKWCSFRGGRCNKGSRTDPTGICSLTDDTRLVTLCPCRFLQGRRIFHDVGALAFGSGTKVLGVPEVSILRVQDQGRTKRVGKIDFIVAQINENNQPVNFAALEVQSVYFSGQSLRPAFDRFMNGDGLSPDARRRPDWRSSAQKRLMPQLGLKIPVFRRWGKKFFVAVDSLFFDAMPKFDTVPDAETSEVTWLVYPFTQSGASFDIGTPRVLFTTWDDVTTALREGKPPTPAEIMEEISAKARKLKLQAISIV